MTNNIEQHEWKASILYPVVEYMGLGHSRINFVNDEGITVERGEWKDYHCCVGFDKCWVCGKELKDE